MKIAYYSDTDSLYTDLSEQTSMESQEVPVGIVLDYDADENMVGTISTTRAGRSGLMN